MHLNHYLADTGHAIQKGLETGLHVLEGGLQFAGTMKGAYELYQAAAPYAKTLAAAGAALL